MTIEIFYEIKSDFLYCLHKRKKYSSEGIKRHIRNNRHRRETIGIGFPDMAIMERARGLKKEISKIFDEKESKEIE